MGRIIAIDYGVKRCGLAVTDESKSFAFGLTTVPTIIVHKYISDYISTNAVDGFVIGEPKSLSNNDTHASSHVRGFVKRLKAEYPQLIIHLIDERFTSSMAKQSIIDSGVKRKGRQDKSLVDMVSATIILQSWIELNSNKN